MRLADESYPTSAHDYASDAEELDRIDSAMNEAPNGALIVSGIAVGLLLLCWLAIYLLVFIPRGTVG